MKNLHKYEFFIFDCDGVILESNRLKSKAFADALIKEDPHLVSKFIEYHKRNGGVSRYEKFRYYFEIIKNQVYVENDIKRAINNFSNIVKEGLLKCDYVPGVLEFIKKLQDQNKLLFVVSGSDEDELIHVFKKRGIFHYFIKIYGSPNNKIENTNKVISELKNKKSGLFLGDSRSDFDAANQFGLDFLFIKEFSEWIGGEKKVQSKNVIRNFKDLE